MMMLKRRRRTGRNEAVDDNDLSLCSSLLNELPAVVMEIKWIIGSWKIFAKNKLFKWLFLFSKNLWFSPNGKSIKILWQQFTCLPDNDFVRRSAESTAGHHVVGSECLRKHSTNQKLQLRLRTLHGWRVEGVERLNLQNIIYLWRVLKLIHKYNINCC